MASTPASRSMTNLPTIRTEHLFRPVQKELIELLTGLADEDWNRPTRSGDWRVRDVAAHLLDGDVRRLSMQRDGYFGPPPDREIDGYETLVDYLDQLNATWQQAFARVSPRVIMELQKLVGPQVCDLFESLDPEGEAMFGVAWAGEEHSTNAFDIAREYTEKWHHQQQIREAVSAPLLDSSDWVTPALETFVRGLPHAYREAQAEVGSSVVLRVTGSVIASWTLAKGEGAWRLHPGSFATPTTDIRMDAEVAWRLFSKMIDPAEARLQIESTGDDALTVPLLGFVGLMV